MCAAPQDCREARGAAPTLRIKDRHRMMLRSAVGNKRSPGMALPTAEASTLGQHLSHQEKSPWLFSCDKVLPDICTLALLKHGHRNKERWRKTETPSFLFFLATEDNSHPLLTLVLWPVTPPSSYHAGGRRYQPNYLRHAYTLLSEMLQGMLKGGCILSWTTCVLQIKDYLYTHRTSGPGAFFRQFHRITE